MDCFGATISHDKNDKIWKSCGSRKYEKMSFVKFDLKALPNMTFKRKS